MDHQYIGIEIGGTKLQVVLGDQEANIIRHDRFVVDREKGAAGVRSRILESIHKIFSKHKVRSIGVGFGAPVDHETGKVTLSYHVNGWEDFEFGRWMKKESGLPVFIDNDANTAALGEALKGAGRDFSKVFYITLGSGVGGGFIHTMRKTTSFREWI